MPNVIKDLPKFKEAVLNEFWGRNPGEYEMFTIFLGMQMNRVLKGDLDEERYEEEWVAKSEEEKGK